MNILDTNINNLAQDQLEELKRIVRDELLKAIDAWDKQDYDELERMLCYSPAGDCMGSENYFINFSWKKDPNNEPKDLYDCILFAKDLQKIIDNKEKENEYI